VPEMDAEYPIDADGGITVERTEDGTVTATGGKRRCYDPWRLDDGTLTPVGFRYQVPASPAEEA